MSYDPGWPPLSDYLLRIARSARDYETIEWVVAVGSCFDGGDFDGEWRTLRWRLDVLRDRMRERAASGRSLEEDGNVSFLELVALCQAILNSPRTRDRNGWLHPPLLAANRGPISAPAAAEERHA